MADDMPRWMLGRNDFSDVAHELAQEVTQQMNDLDDPDDPDHPDSQGRDD